jgi:hypothetical protein
MPLPLLPLALVGTGAAALIYVLVKRKQAGSDQLPADLQGPYNDLLTKGQDPDAIEVVAKKLDGYGYTTQAAALRAREAQLRAGPGKPPAPVTPTPVAPTPVAPTPVAPTPVAPTPVAPVAPVAPAAPAAQFFKVTTSDPAPAGDLALRASPDDSAAITGGAEKDSVVTFKQTSADGKFTLVEALNPAGRRPSATGWGHTQFLVPTNPMNTSGRFTPKTHQLHSRIGIALVGAAVPSGGVLARVASPTGLHMRILPTAASGLKGGLPTGAVVNVLSTIPDRKTDPRAPGAGGWSLVVDPVRNQRGWVMTEWLLGGAT